jgi:hypothetical protein
VAPLASVDQPSLAMGGSPRLPRVAPPAPTLKLADAGFLRLTVSRRPVFPPRRLKSFHNARDQGLKFLLYGWLPSPVI